MVLLLLLLLLLMVLLLLRMLLLLMVMRLMMVQCVAVMNTKRLVRMATDSGSLRSWATSSGQRGIGRTRRKDIFVWHNAERTGKLIIASCTTLPAIASSTSASTRWHTVRRSITRGNGLLLLLFEK
uniref:Putative secreted protein n=1 Tax=Anopheles darlingi TaxID=43151 RepID=A0A2M4DIQ7_ANODA